MDAETTGTERQSHVVDVSSCAFPAANPCAPGTVANLDSCLVHEQHTLPISGAVSLGPVDTFLPVFGFQRRLSKRNTAVNTSPVCHFPELRCWNAVKQRWQLLP